MKAFHAIKDNFEGVACAILSKYIFKDNIEFFYTHARQPAHAITSRININNHSLAIISTGLRDVQSSVPIIYSSTFTELYNNLSIAFPECFENRTVKLFKEHVEAYLDWSWKDKELYLAKNIDELIKILDKDIIITNVANRIAEKAHLVTEDEKNLIKLEKQKISKYVEDRKKIKKRINNFNVVVVYAESYKVELANSLLNKKDETDIVFIIDMNEGNVLVKYNINNKTKHLKKILEDMGASIKKPGIASFNIANTFDQTIIAAITAKL